MKQDNLIVEVAYATPERQKILQCRVPPQTTLIEAVESSGLAKLFPELDLATASFGIWGKVKPANTPLEDGQRIEVYRPLIADPKESRRRRAAKKADKNE